MTAPAFADPGRDQLLSVAEIQQALRVVRAAKPAAAVRDDPPEPSGGGSAAAAALQPDWIAVVAAHSGAGASSVALAITDALSARGERARLIETAVPTRSGLVAATATEFGLDDSGDWRRGSRGAATVYRRACDESPAGWPPANPGTSTVVDLGLPAAASIQRIANERPHLVVVCRPTIPGVRLAEHLLGHFDDGMAIAVAAVGPRRWPGEVDASLGSHLVRLRESGRVVAVPLERRLSVTGPSHLPLSKAVVEAGADLLRLLAEASEQSGRSRRPSRKTGSVG